MKQNIKILIVEDDPAFRFLISEFLSSYHIFPVSSGEEALVLLKSKPKIDLVLCDYNMSGWNGVETIRQLRAISPTTKFILMSGSEPNELSALALAAHADAWLCKPFSEKALLGQVDLLMEVHGLYLRENDTESESKLEKM